MTPGELLVALTAKKVRLQLVDGFLKYKAPKGAYTAEDRRLVAIHKREFITSWRCMSCGRIVPTLYGLRGTELKCRPCAG